MQEKQWESAIAKDIRGAGVLNAFDNLRLRADKSNGQIVSAGRVNENKYEEVWVGEKWGIFG
jgi:hypothetical protein